MLNDLASPPGDAIDRTFIMRNVVRILAALLFFALPALTESFQIGVIYVCNGERLLITGCDIHDMSDAAYCQAEWRDRPQHDGFPAYTSETRGSMRKLTATCTPPSSKQLEARAHFDKVLADAQKKAVADQLASFQVQQTKPAGTTTDPGAIAGRRCLAAGRSQTECLTEALGKSFNSLFGGTGLDTLMRQPSGLRFNGTYRSASGFAITFNPGTTSVPATANVQCGKLDPLSLAYELSLNEGLIALRIPNKPNPISLTLTPTGRLSGPAQAVIEGRIIVGWTNGGGGRTQASAVGESHSETHMESRQIDYGEAHNGTYNATDLHQNGMEYSVNVPVTTTTYDEAPRPVQPVGPSPIYKPKTESCTIGTLVSTGPTRGGTDGVAGMVNLLSGTDEKKTPTPAGVRLVGNYKGPGDLQLEFRSDLALIDCGDVQLARPYTIEFAGANLSVHLNNDGQPLTLRFHPDGTLSGPTSIHINGRIVSGTTPNGDISYAPRSATCSLSTLAPQ